MAGETEIDINSNRDLTSRRAKGNNVNSDKPCGECGRSERYMERSHSRCDVCSREVCRECKPHWCSAICNRCKSVAGNRLKELKALESKRKKIMASWAKESAALPAEHKEQA